MLRDEVANTGFSEHLIAQVITLLRGMARAEGKYPPLVAMVLGQEAERAAWRILAVRYLTAKAEKSNVIVIN